MARTETDEASAGPAPGGRSAAGPATGSSTPASPPLSGRIHYLVGGTLPAAQRDWVAADLTGRGWRLRQALRQAALMVPFAVVFAILPGQAVLRVTLVVFLLVAGLALGFATSGAFRDRRLRAHGLPVPRRSRLSEDELLDAQEAAQAQAQAEAQAAASASEAGEQVPGVQDTSGLGDRPGQ
jgi:hypothetical protein